MSIVLTDPRQLSSRDTLTQIANNASGVPVDALLRSTDSELTPPLRMRQSATPDLVLNIDAISVTNPQTSRKRSIPPILGVIPTFSGATVTFDTTGAGNATPSAGAALALGMSASQYLKVSVSLDSTGAIVLSKGAPASSIASATQPALLPDVYSIGYLVVATDGSNNVQNITNANLYQYVGGSGGAGSGSGEKNYLQSNSSTSNGWGGAGVSVSTDTTASELPRPNTTKTGIKFTASGAGYAYARFILDDADANKILKIQFDCKPISGYVSNQFQVDVYSNTASDYTTGNTRIPLSTDASGVTGIPNAIGTFQSTFTSPGVSAKWIEVRVTRSTGTPSIVISDLIVGPGSIAQGAVVGSWQSYTPNIGGLGAGGVINLAATYRQVGESYEINATFTKDATNGTGSSHVTIDFPNGYTANLNAIGSGSTNGYCNLGPASFYGGAGNGYVSLFNGINTSAVMLINSGYVDGSTMTTGTVVSLHFTVPINELAGGGVLNLGQNDVEYAASTNGTWDADAAATDTVYGTTGAPMTSALTAGRFKTVRFRTPIQPTDKITVEIQGYDAPSSSAWLPAPDLGLNYMVQNSNSYGLQIYGTSVNTDVTVAFEQYNSPTGVYGAAGYAWGAGINWRVKKERAGQAVGFGIVQPGVSSGLVSASGLPRDTSGINAGSDKVGYVITAEGGGSLSSGVWSNSIVQVVPAGTWAVSGAIYLSGTSNVANYFQVELSTVSATPANPPGPVVATAYAAPGGWYWSNNTGAGHILQFGGGGQYVFALNPGIIQLTAPTTLYLLVNSGYASGSVDFYDYLQFTAIK